MKTTHLPGIEDGTHLAIYLIAIELKCRKVYNSLQSIGCDECHALPDLSEAILTMAQGPERIQDEFFYYYFQLLDKYSAGKIAELPMAEAREVFELLKRFGNGD